jgi:hypothetical protein
VVRSQPLVADRDADRDAAADEGRQGGGDISRAGIATNPSVWPGFPAGRSVGTRLVQWKALALISTVSTSWICLLRKKRPMLSSVPFGMALGSKVMVAGGPTLNVAARGRPDGSGWDWQRRPSVTLAGMPKRARSLCRAAGWNSFMGLMVSLTLPLVSLMSVYPAVRRARGVCWVPWGRIGTAP